MEAEVHINEGMPKMSHIKKKKFAQVSAFSKRNSLLNNAWNLVLDVVSNLVPFLIEVLLEQQNFGALLLFCGSYCKSVKNGTILQGLGSKKLKFLIFVKNVELL